MIKSFKRLLSIALLVLLLVWLFLFALANDAAVPLDLVLWVLPERHVSWWLMGAFGSGLLIGWMLAVIAGWIHAARKRHQGTQSK